MKKNWKKNLEDFINKYKDKFDSCYLVGSLVYQSKFTNKSDIDLIIILNSIKDWEYACKEFINSKQTQNFISETKMLYLNNKAQYFCLKFKYKNIFYSIDFILKDFVQKAINDLKKNKNIIYYRATNKPQKNEYEFGYMKYRIKITKKNIFYKYCTLISSPLCIIKKKFYFGIFLDKLITGYIQLWEKGERKNKLSCLCVQSIIKWASINKTNNMDKIIGSLNRIDVLPRPYIKKQILLYRNKLLKYKKYGIEN